MIITKTNHRISILGGSTDTIPHLATGKSGIVLGFGLAQYTTASVRYLPKYFDYKSRLAYSKIETVKSNVDIEHRVIKEALRYFDLDDGIEITHIADVPSYSGLGSSSSFLVNLINCLAHLKGYKPTPMDLYLWATDIEQNKLKENVGLQDSLWAAYSNIGYMKFKSREEVQYIPIHYTKDALEDLERHCMLFFTGGRISSQVTKYYKNFGSQAYQMDRLVDMTNMGIEALKARNYPQLSKLMGASWDIKRGLDASISGPKIDEANEKVKKHGGFMKLCGGGGGAGCIFILCPPDEHDNIRKDLTDFTEIQVKVDTEGPRIIFNNGEH